jgi:hypothetical protein
MELHGPIWIRVSLKCVPRGCIIADATAPLHKGIIGASAAEERPMTVLSTSTPASRLAMPSTSRSSPIGRHAETRRVEIGGFRTLAGAWAGFRDWAMRSKLRLTIY